MPRLGKLGGWPVLLRPRAETVRRCKDPTILHWPWLAKLKWRRHLCRSVPPVNILPWAAAKVGAQAPGTSNRQPRPPSRCLLGNPHPCGLRCALYMLPTTCSVAHSTPQRNVPATLSTCIAEGGATGGTATVGIKPSNHVALAIAGLACCKVQRTTEPRPDIGPGQTCACRVFGVAQYLRKDAQVMSSTSRIASLTQILQSD